MGCHDNTKKLTAQDVKRDIFNQVLENARSLLQSKTGKTLDSSAQIDDIMLELTNWRFSEEYPGLAFNKDPSYYTTTTLPDMVEGTHVTPVSQLGSIDENTDVDQFIDTVLLSKVIAPDWVMGNAKGAIKTLAKQLISQDTRLQVQFDDYQDEFDGQNEDEDSWKVISVVSFITGSLLEDSITANISIIYFLALYYKVNSPTRDARIAIQDEAYKTATIYTAFSRPINNVPDLTNALRGYAASGFQKHFDFDYKATSPPGTDPKASSPVRSSNEHLFYFPDLKTGDLAGNVDAQFFQGFNVPTVFDTIKQKALNDTVKHIQSILLDQQAGSWSDTFISQTYFPNDPTLNTIQYDAIVIHFYEHKTADNQKTVSNTYIYCLGLMWETLSPEKVLAQDMLDVMVNQLHKQLGEPQTHGALLAEMKGDLLKYAKDEFLTSFGFAFDGDNSKPLDKFSPTAKVRGFSALTHFTKYPVSVSDVTDWIDADLFPRNTNKFPNYAGPGLYDTIKKDTQYCLAHFASDSMWDSSGHDVVFDAPAAANKHSVKASITHIFGLADMTEGGVHNQVPYIYVLIVCRSVNPESDWD